MVKPGPELKSSFKQRNRLPMSIRTFKTARGQFTWAVFSMITKPNSSLH